MRPSIAQHLTRVLPFPRHRVLRVLNRFTFDGLAHSEIVRPRRPFSQFNVEIHEIDELIQQSIYFFGYYELRESLFCKETLRAGDLFVDVGANLGWFTLLGATSMGPQGRVVAFEPSSMMRTRLARNVRLNQLTNVEIRASALGSTEGRMSLHGGSAVNLGHFTLAPGFRENGEVDAETVDVTTLDDWWLEAGRPNIRLLKLDVEGYELQVLEGGVQVVESGAIEQLIVEVSAGRQAQVGYGPGDLFRFLGQFNTRVCELGFGEPRPLRNQRALEGNVLVKFLGAS